MLPEIAWLLDRLNAIQHNIMKKKHRTVIYMNLRSSNQNFNKQREGLIGYAKHSGLEVINEYLDITDSFSLENRLQLGQLMQAARHCQFDCVLVWKLDGFACNLSHLATALQEFDSLNIRFVSMQDQMDTNGSRSEIMLTTIKAMLNFKSTIHGERVRAGMIAAETKGKRIGRPKTPPHLIKVIEELARETNFSINRIREETANSVSYGTTCKIIKRVRDNER